MKKKKKEINDRKLYRGKIYCENKNMANIRIWIDLRTLIQSYYGWKENLEWNSDAMRGLDSH